MRQKESVLAFKNELRNYTYYHKEVARLSNRVEELYERLGGVRGIDPSKEPLHVLPDKDLEYAIRDDISRLDAKISQFTHRIKEIDEILVRIENPVRDALISVYAKGKTVDSVAMRMEISPSGVVKRFNRAIEKALL